MKKAENDELMSIIDSSIHNLDDKFVCKLCGMLGNSMDNVRNHLLIKHPLHLRYTLMYKRIPQIAVKPWIHIKYNFTYRMESFINIQNKINLDTININNEVESEILNRLKSVKKFVLIRVAKNEIDSFQIGIKNDFFGYIYWINKTYFKEIQWIKKQYSRDYEIYWLDKNFRINKNFKGSMPGEIPLMSLYYPKIKKEDKLSLIGFNRVIQINYWINKKEKEIDITLIPKSITPGLRIQEEAYFSKSKKKENKGYGYSPIDFITDSLLLCEADRNFDEKLDIREVSDITIEKNKPFIVVMLNKLTIKYPVEERIKLLLEYPEIEERCFRPIDFQNSLMDIIRYYKNSENKNKTTKNWLFLVDKLINRYKISL